MPGPAMHHMIADRLKAAIQSGRGLGEGPGPDEVQKLQDLLADPKNLPYLFFGCHGPDPFFFNTKDLNPTVGKLVEVYNDVGDFIDDFKEALLSVVPQPVLDALEAFDEAVDEVIEDSALLSELEQTFNDINNVLTGLQATLTEALKAFVSDFNLFDLISHPYRDGAAEGEWWWFDAMHYRKTGRMAEELLNSTRDMSSPHHLYALGYLTHVGADTVGHAYVNLWSGGPYRSQSQRHKTGENFQDVFNLLNVTGQDWNRSKIHALCNFNFTGTISDEEPEGDPKLPPDFAAFLAEAMNKVYQEDGDPDPDYASRITASDVDDTYRLWYRFMKSFTDTGTLPAPVAYSLTAELREVWEKTTDNLDEVGDFLEDATDTASDFGILSIFILLAALVIAAVMAAAALADGIAGAVVTLGTATIRYAACLIYEQVYNAFMMFRLSLALNGLGFPMIEHLTDPRLRQFVTPSMPDPTGTVAANVAGREPLLRFSADFLGDPLAAIFNQERHLIYPLTDGEKSAVQPAPASYFTQFATHYAFGRIPLDDDLVTQLAAMQDAGGDPDEAALLALLGKRTLGNGLDFSGHLYGRWFRGLRIPDFNLDSDRGYGFLCWRQKGDSPNEPTRLITNIDQADPRTVSLTILP
ncbi:zinc dependent phospholipase C family protein [Rhodovulum viride]|nr:zinc dependent phospholipase C family protein [Rhodovulum viride]